MRLVFVLFLFVAVGLAAGCGGDDPAGPTPPTTGTMQVDVVRNGAVEPLATVVVFATDTPESSAKHFGTTGANGRCTVANLPAGTYSVTASKSVAGALHTAQSDDISITAGSTTPTVILLMEATPDLWPMAPGNWWAVGQTDTLRLVTKIVDGVTAYVPDWTATEDDHPPYLSHGRYAIYKHGYETITGDDRIMRPPTVYIDFTANAGECWTIRDWGQGCLESKSETVQTPLGEFTNCWTVKLRSSGANEFYFSLKEGIGPVKFVFRGETFLLSGFELK